MALRWGDGAFVRAAGEGHQDQAMYPEFIHVECPLSHCGANGFIYRISQFKLQA
jgi:hypothetical protein